MEKLNNILSRSASKIEIVKEKNIPFEINNSLFNSELENALKECALIEKDYNEKKRKGYNNVYEMLESIIDD